MATDTSRSSSRQLGAVAVDHDRPRRRAGWLKWLLPLLLLVAIAVALISLLGGDDDPKSTGASTGGASGALTAGGSSLSGDSIGDAVGRTATGKDVRVLAVKRGSGFWVGSSPQDRTFVEWGSAAGGNENQTFIPQVGDHVGLTGPVQKAPADPAKVLHLGGADARLVTREGAFVNADRVEPR